MDNNAVAERIKFLMKELNYRQVDFAQKIDIDTSNLSKYLNGRLAMSEALINKIVVNLGVSKQWLETGEDLPFAKQQPQQLVTVPESRIVTEPSVATAKRGTPVYDIDVTAGYMPQARMFTDDQIVGFVGLPTPDEQKALGEAATLVSPNWLISTYLVLTFGELLLSPMGISFVTKVAPPKLKGLMMGGWFASTALGNFLVSVGGYLWGDLPLWVVWSVFIGVCVVSALFMFIMMKRLEKVAK